MSSDLQVWFIAASFIIAQVTFFFPFGVDRELMVLLLDWVRINEQY
jgi:hypothetical protein